jgi:hypothetical protein
MWLSKGQAEGQSPMTSFTLRPSTQATSTAHYVVDGAPLCAALKRKDGVPLLRHFKCSWVPLRAFDRKCGYCRRLESAKGGGHG